MSGIFGATVIPGNRITDFAKQTATVGTPIPFGYGKFPVTQTNVIWIDDVKEHVTKKKQGKGGVKTEEYTYTRSYAIGVCQGPVYGFLIIRRNGKVVYTEDPNAPIDDKTYAAKWRQSVQFYFGTRDQLPDSTIEAVEGAGQISAFRDVAYFVVENDDVTDGAGAVPSYEVVVMGTLPEVYLTSMLYPLVDTDSLTNVVVPLNATMIQGYQDALRNGVTIDSGALDVLVTYSTYSNYAPESLQNGVTLDSGLLEVLVKYSTYSNYQPESLQNSATVDSGSLDVVAGYITYSSYPPESLQNGVTIDSGTLV